MQGRGEPAFGRDELGVPADPPRERFARLVRRGQRRSRVGAGVYLAAVGNNNNLNTGLFDQLFAANGGTTFSAANSTTAYNAIDQMFTRYVGPAETLPSNGNISFVDLEFKRGAFRW